MAIRTKPVSMEVASKTTCGSLRGFYPVPGRSVGSSARPLGMSKLRPAPRETIRPPRRGEGVGSGKLSLCRYADVYKDGALAHQLRCCEALINSEHNKKQNTPRGVSETGETFGWTLRPWPTQGGSEVNQRNVQTSGSLVHRQKAGARVRLLPSEVDYLGYPFILHG
jgi:hypothetical protein